MSEQVNDAPITGAPPSAASGGSHAEPTRKEVAAWGSERLMREVEQAPLPANVGALLRDCAEDSPDHPALVFFDDDETITFGELHRRVAQVANALTGLGVEHGTHISVMVQTEATYPLTWLANASIGAVTQPLNYNYTGRELHYMLTDSDAEFLVIDAGLLAVFEGMEEVVLPKDRVLVVGARAEGYPHHWDDLVPGAAESFAPAREPSLDDLMNIQYTSGTTGMPKGAMQTQRFWLTFGRVSSACFQDRLERILIAQPFYYVDAQWLFLMTAYRRATAYVARKQSGTRFLGWLKKYRIQYCNFPEVVAKQMAQEDDSDNDMIVASCYSHRPENYPWYEERYGFLARQGFLMTETGAAVYVPMEAWQMTGTATVGVPTAFREAAIMSPEGKEVPRGEIGEICIRTKAGFPRSHLLGYYNKPEATEAAFFEGDWFRTGDAGRQTQEGWFFYLGRRKDMVKRSGENVSAVEVEGVLRGLDEILEAAVVPVPDDYRGEEVKAYLLLAEGKTKDDCPPGAVIAHCEKNLARFKIPRYLEYIAEFPRTPSLKIKKSGLLAAKADLREGCYDCQEERWR